MSELLQLVKEKIIGNYEIKENGTKSYIIHKDFIAIVYDWNRKVGFDIIVREEREHKLSIDANKKLIFFANGFSAPAKSMANSNNMKHLSIFDKGDILTNIKIFNNQ